MFFLCFSTRNPVSIQLLLDKKSFLRQSPYAEIIKDFMPQLVEMDFDFKVRQMKGIYYPLYL